MLQEMYSYLMYQKCFDHKNQAQFGNFMLHFTLGGMLL